jgi:Escherichia/Staphylococcus phage prohead protease
MGTLTAYHEASHAVAAVELGVPVFHVSIRGGEDSAGRTSFSFTRQTLETVGDYECAVVKVCGEVGERIAAGETRGRFNWLEEGGDAEDARSFVSRLGVDDLNARQNCVSRAYALLRMNWPAVEEVAGKLQRHTTILGAEVEQIVNRHRREKVAEQDRLRGWKPIERPKGLSLAAKRSFAIMGDQLEMRALRPVGTKNADESFTVRGYAARYNELSHDLGGFRERIAPGAFDEVLATDPDVHFVWDHDTRYVLARTRSKTLQLTSDTKGLRVNAQVGNYSYARDLRTALERGDINQASFAFTVAPDGQEFAQNDEGHIMRTIRNIGNLYDVTVTAQGAYPQTSMGVG